MKRGNETQRTPRSKGWRRDTELLEGENMETPSSINVSTKLERIAKGSEPVTRGAGCGKSARPDLGGGRLEAAS